MIRKYPEMVTGRLARRRRSSGLMLIEAMVYIAVATIVMGASLVAFFQVLDHTRSLRRISDDITRAIEAGERWRVAARAATAPLKLVTEGDLQALHVPRGEHELIYFFDGSSVFTRAHTNEHWKLFLEDVQSSSFKQDQGQRVTSWRWELELKPRRKTPRTKPLFTFQTVVSEDHAR